MRARAASVSAICALRPASRGSSAPISGCRCGRSSSGWCPVSGLNALTRVPLGKWRDDPDLLALYEAALRETVAVGLAEGVKLSPDSVEKGMAMMRSMPPYHMTSMGNDLLRGSRLELPWFAGK